MFEKVDGEWKKSERVGSQLLLHGQDVTRNFVRALLRNKMTAIRDRSTVQVFGYHFNHTVESERPDDPGLDPSFTTSVSLKLSVSADLSSPLS